MSELWILGRIEILFYCYYCLLEYCFCRSREISVLSKSFRIVLKCCCLWACTWTGNCFCRSGRIYIWLTDSVWTIRGWFDKADFDALVGMTYTLRSLKIYARLFKARSSCISSASSTAYEVLLLCLTLICPPELSSFCFLSVFSSRTRSMMDLGLVIVDWSWVWRSVFCLVPGFVLRCR